MAQPSAEEESQQTEGLADLGDHRWCMRAAVFSVCRTSDEGTD